MTGVDIGYFDTCAWEPLPQPDVDLTRDFRSLTERELEGYDCICHLAAISNLSSFRLRENSLASGAGPEIFRATSLYLSPGRRLGEKRKQIQPGKQRVELWWDLSQQSLGVLPCNFQRTDPDCL